MASSATEIDIEIDTETDTETKAKARNTPIKTRVNYNWYYPFIKFFEKNHLLHSCKAFETEVDLFSIPLKKTILLDSLEVLIDDLLRVLDELDELENIEYIQRNIGSDATGNSGSKRNDSTPQESQKYIRKLEERLRKHQQKEVLITLNNDQEQEELDRFLERQREIINESNNKEFLVEKAEGETRCSRVDARELNRGVQMERDVLEGTYLFNMHSNPQKATDTDGNSAEVKPSANELNKNSALSGLEERIENLKTHLNLTFKDYPSKLSIHQKVSALEERIMQLERDYPVWSALHFVQSGEKLPNPSSYTIVASKDPKSNSVQLKKTKLTPSLNNPLPAKNTSTIAQDMYSNYESNTNSNLKASSLVISEPDILIPNSPKKRKRGRPRLTDYVNINTTPSTSFSFMKPRSKVKIDNKRKKRKYTKREKAVDVNELVNNNTGDAISSSKMDKLIKEQVELLNKNRAQSTSQSQAQFAGKVYWPFSNSKRTSSLTKAVLTKFLSKQQQEISKFTINNDANAGLNMPTGRNVASSSHHMVDGNTTIDSTGSFANIDNTASAPKTMTSTSTSTSTPTPTTSKTTTTSTADNPDTGTASDLDVDIEPDPDPYPETGSDFKKF